MSQDAAVEAAAARANAAFVARLLAKAQDEYTSKHELRRIAISALVTLESGYLAMAEMAEAEAVAAAENVGLIVPAGGMVTAEGPILSREAAP